MPFLKLRKAMLAMAVGERVEVLSTDPLAPADFAELCDSLGHCLLHTSTEDGIDYTHIEIREPGQGVK